MKKILSFVSSLFLSISLFAQLPVSTTPENKNVILEEFTGIHCQYCPDGHKRANQLAADNPGDVFLINIHAGGYAVPGAGEPDFRTEFGEAIDDQSNLAGYPAGTVNRHLFPAYSMNDGGTAMGRGSWSAAAGIILAEASYANVALEASLDVSTRLLTVDVEIYFTGTGANSVNLNVAITQDNIQGPQTGAETWYPEQILPNGNYVHNHMLRHLLTGQWGEVITTTTQGTTVSRQYTYTLPENINDVNLTVEDLNVVAFIVEGRQEVITGSNGPISYTGLLANDASLETIDVNDEVCVNTIDPLITIKNFGLANLSSAVITYNFDNQETTTFNWSGDLTTFEELAFRIPGIIVPNEGGMLNFNIISVNGEEDTGTSNNALSKNITKLKALGANYIISVVQDRWGSEITWALKTENGQTIASGGPYSDLGNPGTLEHIAEITVPSLGCYNFIMNDSYGDGFGAASQGEGSYQMIGSDGTVVFSKDGNIGSSRITPFDVISLVSFENNLISYSFNEEGETDLIISGDRLINVSLPNDVDISSLIATFSISELASVNIGGVEQISGVTANDFSDTVIYTVISESQDQAEWSVVVSQTIAVDVIRNEKLMFYPNPSQGKIFIENVSNGSLLIYDIVGRKVFDKEIYENTNSIDVSSLKNGTYIIKVFSNNINYTNKFTLIK